MTISDISIIGAGTIAGRHLAAIRGLHGPPVRVHVSDRDAGALAGFGADDPEVLRYTDSEALLAREPVPEELCIVATPPRSHAALSCQALASGRHVLCEKPLAMDRHEAEAMLAAARSAGRRLGCCSMRFLGPERDAARALLRGGIGRLYHGRWIDRRLRNRAGIEYQPGSPWFVQRSVNGGGPLMDWGPYDFSTLHALLGPQRVEVIDAVCERPAIHAELPAGIVPDVEYHVAARLHYHLQDGSLLRLDYERSSAMHGPEESRQLFFGSTGGMELAGFGDGGYRLCRDQAGTQQQEEHSAPLAAAGPTPRERPLHHMLAALAGARHHAVLDAQAVFNFACIAAVYACAANGRPQCVALEDFA